MVTTTHIKYESGRYTAATLQPRVSPEEVEAKGHSQTDGETILSELHSIPRCNKETPSVSERGSLVLLSHPPKHHRKHMQKLGQQSCTSYLSSPLDCGT